MADPQRFNTIGLSEPFGPLSYNLLSTGGVDATAHLTPSPDSYGLIKGGFALGGTTQVGGETIDLRGGVYGGPGIDGAVVGTEVGAYHRTTLSPNATLDTSVRVGAELPIDYSGGSQGIAPYAMACGEYDYRDPSGISFVRRADVDACAGLYNGDIAGFVRAGVEVPLSSEHRLYGTFNVNASAAGNDTSFGARAGLGRDFDCPSFIASGQCAVEGGVSYQSDAPGGVDVIGTGAALHGNNGVGGFLRLKVGF